MKIRQAVFPFMLLGLLFCVAGCDNAPRNFNTYADLNDDGKPEIVFGDYGQSHWTYVDYNLVARFSGETVQTEPSLIQQFKDRPDQIHFTDIDNDGDLDLVFSVYGQAHWTYVDYDTYVAKNDGLGNFGSPELINRQKK